MKVDITLEYLDYLALPHKHHLYDLKDAYEMITTVVNHTVTHNMHPRETEFKLICKGEYFIEHSIAANNPTFTLITYRLFYN